MEIMSTLAAIPGGSSLLPYVAGGIALCAAISVALPPPSTGATGVYPMIYAVVNFVALNFGHARNAGTTMPLPAAEVPSPSGLPPAPPAAHA